MARCAGVIAARQQSAFTRFASELLSLWMDALLNGSALRAAEATGGRCLTSSSNMRSLPMPHYASGDVVLSCYWCLLPALSVQRRCSNESVLHRRRDSGQRRAACAAPFPYLHRVQSSDAHFYRRHPCLRIFETFRQSSLRQSCCLAHRT